MKSMTAATKTDWVLTALSMSFVGLSVGFIFGSVKANRMTETRMRTWRERREG